MYDDVNTHTNFNVGINLLGTCSTHMGIRWFRYKIKLVQNYLHNHDGTYDWLSEPLYIHKYEYVDEINRED